MAQLTDILNIDPDAKAQAFSKGHVLQREGEVAAHAFYVKSGLLRAYSIDPKGKEHIFMFAPEGWILADLESTEFQQPAELFIECIEASEVVVFDRKHFFETSLSTAQLMERIQLLSRRLGMLQRRMIQMMSAPAIERYEYFLETYPELPNRVPQRMIASYLGITPEALSKIRGARVKKE